MSTLAFAKLLHLLSMSVWIGGGLLPPWDARRSLALGKPYAEALLDRLAIVGRLLIAAGVVTLATGLWLTFLKGGFKAVSPRIHIGLGLTILIFALGPFTEAAVSRLRKTVAADDDAGARATGRRFTLLASLEEVIRIAVLCLMVSAA
jgi:putative copper export protein